MSCSRPSSEIDFVSPVMACFVDVYGAENSRDFYYSVLANLVLTY